jgi:integrase
MLIEALEPGSALRLIVETLVTTGMRTLEIFGLKWKYVDLDTGTIQVRERNYRGDQGKPKSRRSRRNLPINGLTAKFRDFQPADASPEDFVFNDSGLPLDERSVLRYQLRPAAKATGVDFEGFGWHTFRRTHLTTL